MSHYCLGSIYSLTFSACLPGSLLSLKYRQDSQHPNLRFTQAITSRGGPNSIPQLFRSSAGPSSTMTAEMDWSPDFCLTCDRQSSTGAYCSQACRLTDIEKAGSEPVSPTMTGPAASWASSCMGTGSGFYLPPAVDFAAYKSSGMAPSPTALRNAGTSSAQACYFSHPASRTSQSTSSSSFESASKRGLTPSSSRTSLSSMRTTSTQEGQLSDQARSELRSYASSFDQVRDWKRRMTTT